MLVHLRHGCRFLSTSSCHQRRSIEMGSGEFGEYCRRRRRARTIASRNDGHARAHGVGTFNLVAATAARGRTTPHHGWTVMQQHASPEHCVADLLVPPRRMRLHSKILVNAVRDQHLQATVQGREVGADLKAKTLESTGPGLVESFPGVLRHGASEARGRRGHRVACATCTR